jgi:DNA (cytosine-5)-methyltransferase 1
MKHLDLFSGIGGFALACQWAGIETIGFVEIDKYSQKVLRKHWPNVPIVEDIRDVKKIKTIADSTGKRFPDGRRPSLAVSGTTKSEPKRCRSSRNRIQDNSGDRRGCPESPTILITVGFPCQPFSVAGKRQSKTDDRYLWPETLAVIEAIKPQWVLLENVTGIINLALDTVLSDLEGAGYSYETLVIPACAVNAWHRRDRVWIIANYAGDRCNSGAALGRNRFSSLDQDEATSQGKQTGEGWLSESRQIGNVPNTKYPKTTRQRGYSGQVYGITESEGFDIRNGEDWWAVEPELGRVAHGIPHRVDRLKCLGNAIVPQVAYEIIKVIASFEEIQERKSEKV